MARRKKDEKLIENTEPTATTDDSVDTVAQANENLGKEIYEAYTENPFGKVLKSEIDKMVFHSFLVRSLPEICKSKGAKSFDGKTLEMVQGNNVMYLRLSKKMIYRLSMKAGVKESTIQSMLEADFYKYTKDTDNNKIDYDAELKAALSYIVYKARESESNFGKDGIVRVVVANPITKKMLMQKLDDIGAVGDYSFNRDIVSMSVVDLLKVMDTTDEEIKEKLLKIAEEEYKKDHDKYLEIEKEIKNKSIWNYLKSIGDFALKDLIGKVNSGLVDIGTTYVKTKLQSFGIY